MPNSVFFITVGLIALATLICRGAFIVPPNAHHLSKRLDNILEFIPISATAAIAISSLVYDGATEGYSVAPERLIAGMIAFGVAYLTKSAVATIVIGMAAIWMLGLINL